MSGYIDIHCHMLSGVDDGAKDDGEMFRMLDIAYSSGTRVICLTPHFNPRYYGNNSEASAESFERLRAYASEKYPDLTLMLGNELNYFLGADEYIVSGDCRTIDGSRNILVDFLNFNISFFEIRAALYQLKSQGFVPIFAHAERYDCIKPPFFTLNELKDAGMYIHINANSVTGEWGRKLQKKALKIIKTGFADAVASDAHDTSIRSPRLDLADAALTKHFGSDIADKLLKQGPKRLLGI